VTNGGNQSPFDWDSFERQFKQFNPMENMFGNMHMSRIQEFVRQQLDQAFSAYETNLKPKPMQSDPIQPTSVSPSVSETDAHMIAKIKIPDHVDPRKVKASYAGHKLKIEGLSGQPTILSLPSIGSRKGVTAVMKDNILEIQIPKRADENYQELFIKYLS
jgi:hypothetical protein